MKVVTADEMRNIDAVTIREYGIPSAVLMERAGLAVANKFVELFGKKKVLVLAGGGNNGGDGLVSACELLRRGCNVKVIMTSKEKDLGSDCLARLKTAKKSGVPIEFKSSINSADLHGAAVIDALFGTGLNKPVKAPLSGMISALNRSSASVLSVDIPSGISADNGEVLGEAVMADATVTFGLPKRGHMLFPGAQYAGRLFVEDIGFPIELLTSGSLRVETIEKDIASALVPDRPRYSHKGDYGHVLVVAGSRGKTGAAIMTGKACMRTGAGMATLCVPESLSDIFQSRVTEEMVVPLSDHGSGTIAESALDEILSLASSKADVIAVGPGIGVTRETKILVTELVKLSTAPLVIDADGLNSLCKDMSVLRQAKAPVILTPHPGEMARLIKALGNTTDNTDLSKIKQVADLEQDRIESARSFSLATGSYLVLKGVPTVISDPEGRVFINTTGNPGMATAGAGDVLTGMIAAFLGQGLLPVDSCTLGVFMHGMAGDIASSVKGQHSLIASDIIESIPSAFLELR